MTPALAALIGLSQLACGERVPLEWNPHDGRWVEARPMELDASTACVSSFDLPAAGGTALLPFSGVEPPRALTCAAEGPSILLAWTPSVTGTARLQVTGSAAVQIAEGCADAPPIACAYEPSGSAVLTAPVRAGARHTIAVGAPGWVLTGDVVLSVEIAP